MSTTQPAQPIAELRAKLAEISVSCRRAGALMTAVRDDLERAAEIAQLDRTATGRPTIL